MDYLEIARRAKANFQKDRQAQPETVKPIDEGRIIAYLIASDVLGADIWLALDDSFTADDGLAVFYADELPFLATKDAETLREIHKVKLAFPGCRVIQEGPEANS
jgi:hypothetical protein